MNTREGIKIGVDMARFICDGYVNDLTDEELMMRPHEGCNHLNWQIGHLITSEYEMINGIAPGSMPDLPEGMTDKYSKEAAESNDASQFMSKEELFAARDAQRAAFDKVLAETSDEEMEKPSPESMQSYAPNVAAVLSMIGSHLLMHGGQWVIVRRQLGKPAMF